jgi:hypothetical protein
VPTPSVFGNVDMPRLGRENHPYHEAPRRDHDRVREPRVDVPGRGYDGDDGRWQEAAESAVADVIGERQAAGADPGREQLDQPSGNLRIHQRHVDREDRRQQRHQDAVDFGGIRSRRVAMLDDGRLQDLGEIPRIGCDGLAADLD